MSTTPVQLYLTDFRKMPADTELTVLVSDDSYSYAIQPVQFVKVIHTFLALRKARSWGIQVITENGTVRNIDMYHIGATKFRNIYSRRGSATLRVVE